TEGTVRCGDGARGLVPPAGRDNIVCAVYRAGGGSAGNQPAGAINQLKTAIPSIKLVTNPVAADGGADAEPLAAVPERAPQMFHHRGRAVSAADFESLALEVEGTRVARARCLPGRNRDLLPETGWVTVVVLPRGTDKKLLPSSELVAELES